MTILLLVFTFGVGTLAGFVWGYLLGQEAGELKAERLALSDAPIVREIRA